MVWKEEESTVHSFPPPKIPPGTETQTHSLWITSVSAAERDEMKIKSVKEGESVTLDPGEIKNPSKPKLSWYFNDVHATEINGDQSKICIDGQCDERFRGRLKLDHQTGSLTITNTKTEHAGFFKVEIISRSFKIIRSFIVTVTGLSSAAIVGICAAVLLVAAAAFVIYYHNHQAIKKVNHVGDSSSNQTEPS
ncbi:CD48 antigen [Labeo rohita]|uniref:CD48 antigen n=1 Tax=Labeo rohita TaxID=84645 RepID=A0ABQ8LAH8_LABRO|nr:CD48 antigen [Labeo rohita]